VGTDAHVCPQCGWTFDVAAIQSNTCRKCRSALLITSVAYLEKFDKPAIQKYLARYSNILKTAPDDRDALLAMGICYLRLDLYELASQFLTKLIAICPSEAASYYYKTISGLKGRRPRTLSLTTIREIEQLLLTAMALEPQNARHDLLLAAVRHDYYVLNGLRVPPPTPYELVQGADGKYIDRREIRQGLALAKIGASPVDSLIGSLDS
jgi:tetratricopeptide (TPR) repeat protein